ncbi:MAG: sulfonate transporter substrate-binding protein, partial [Tardiphaga sp.]|nr:sulfonate transporter substrate-binding protein [Tardiphaga sp.]
VGYKVVWTEFPSGPPLLEALNVGAIDFGNTGEAPPIFAQAAGAPIQYVAYEPPAPKGEAILVQKDSKLNSVAELKGKKVALNKGSNVHYLLVKVLEKAGVKYSEIEPVFLAPADARAAFERGAVDAWVIWDPFQAAAEAATGARALADGTGIVSNYQFYFASKKFLESDPKTVDLVLAQLSEVDDWAKSDIHAVAEQLAPAVGLPVAVVEVALKRQSYGIKPLSDAVIADQQQVADTFFALGLLPKQIRIADVARRPGT